MINIVYRLISPKLFEEAYDEIDVNKDVVVRPTFLSICKADQRYYQGERPSDVLDEKLPMALIHEGIGEVVYDNNGEFDVGNCQAFCIGNVHGCVDPGSSELHARN